jgi:hypothetical protein
LHDLKSYQAVLQLHGLAVRLMALLQFLHWHQQPSRVPVIQGLQPQSGRLRRALLRLRQVVVIRRLGRFFEGLFDNLRLNFSPHWFFGIRLGDFDRFFNCCV